MGKFNETEPNAINLIGAGTTITGDINCNGDIRVDGILHGNILTKGKVVIGETGKIKGEINCKNADVSGEIDGKIRITELLALKATAKINGDITTNKLAIDPGSRFTGTCNMTGSETSNHAEKKPDRPETTTTKP